MQRSRGCDFRKQRISNLHKWYVHAACLNEWSLTRVHGTAEFKTNVDLVDPSNHNVGEFSINCFGKVENCLPKPKKGDILLIRQLQVRTNIS